MITERISDWTIYARLLGYVKPWWIAFLVSVMGYLVYSGSNAALAELMKYIVDAIGSGDAAERMLIPVTLVIVVFLRGIGSFFGTYFITYVSANVVHALRCELFEQLLKLPSSFYDKNVLGHLVAKVTFHVTQVTGAATNAVKVVIREGFTVLGLLLYLLYKNWLLTIIFILVAPLIALLVSFAGRRFRKISERIQHSMGDVTHVVSEAVQGYRVVRTFGGAEYERTRFHKVSDYNRQQSMKMVVTSAISTPIIQLVISIAMGFLVWLALDPSLMSNMTAGDVIAFITAAGLLMKPVRQLSEVNATIQKGLAAAKDIFNLFDEGIEEDEGETSLTQVRGEIEFKNVSFAYGRQTPEVLKDISFTASPGQTIALVGRSGSGKSTLASLIPRFYSPTRGKILIDSEPIEDLSLLNLRSHIAVVTQQVTLFNDTVARNIAYGSLGDADLAAITRAARKANALEFIGELGEGMNTVVGDDGVLISGGQRQRLALARAFLKDAPILILDEATSALDSESERLIQSALENVIKGRTTFIIAHRLSTIESADVILVIDEGRIVEQGTHRELLQRNSFYAQLHKHQLASSTDDDRSKGQEQERSKGLFPVHFSRDTGIPWRSEQFNPLLKAWYSNSVWVKLLRPFSYLFQLLARKRRQDYIHKASELWEPPVPVVVVGNINIGGTGKSPLVIWLAEQFRSAGFKPGIVSRGYGGNAPQYPFEVTEKSEPAEAGEEAVMIAKRTACPVVVDKDRTKAVQTLLENNECEIVICDDGLQHYALKRDVEIAVLDGKKGLGNGLCLPAGPLREPPERLREVDFVVVNGEESMDLPCTATHMSLKPDAWVNLHTQEELAIADWPGSKQVHAVAGIGNPNRFFDTLRELSFDVVEHHYEDHQIYHVSDLVFGDKLPVVMTEKDAVKCRLLNRELMHNDYWYLKVSVDIDDQFMQLVMASVQRDGKLARTVILDDNVKRQNWH